jgi:cardiolipin synthase (CMP-forming)
MSNIIQETIDQFWKKSLFRILPKKVTPNYFTALRLILIPVILYFIAMQYFWWALIFFIISAVTDTIDGSLARVRKQTSPLGKLLDPIADKLLIILILILAAFFYIHSAIIFLVVLFDLLALLSGLLFIILKSPEAPNVNWGGKSKALFEIISVVLVLVFLASTNYWIGLASFIALAITAILSLLVLATYWIVTVTVEVRHK